MKKVLLNKNVYSIYKIFIINHCNHCINSLLLYDYYTNLKKQTINFTIYSNLPSMSSLSSASSASALYLSSTCFSFSALFLYTPPTLSNYVSVLEYSRTPPILTAIYINFAFRFPPRRCSTEGWEFHYRDETQRKEQSCQ